MKILGIDPGSCLTGFGVIERSGGESYYVASGCIRPGKLPWPDRLGAIFKGISEVIQQYRPHLVAIEQVFVHKNVASALKLGQARGAALSAAVCQGLPVSEYAPRQIKKTIAGYGGAEKAQMQEMVRILLQLNGVPSKDAADALAVALCHSQTLSWEQAL